METAYEGLVQMREAFKPTLHKEKSHYYELDVAQPLYSVRPILQQLDPFFTLRLLLKT